MYHFQNADLVNGRFEKVGATRNIIDLKPVHRAGLPSPLHGIDDDEALGLGDDMKEPETFRPALDHFHPRWQVHLLQGSSDVNAHTLIGQELVAHTQNDNVGGVYL
jgi:hypothetical protein